MSEVETKTTGSNQDVDVTKIDTSTEKENATETISFDEMLKNEQYSAEYQKRVKESIDKALKEKEEADKLKSMTETERADAEAKKKAKELEEREAKIVTKELRSDALELLREAGMPAKLADILSYSSKEAMQKSLNTVKETFTSAVSASVEARLGNGTSLKKAPETKNNATDDEAIKNAVNGIY